MVVEIVPYTDLHIAAVREFNARLRQGGVPYSFPESDVPAWLPPGSGSRLYQQFFVAVEAGTVHGGYILKHQEFSVCGEVKSVGAFQLPLSEGTVDRQHAVLAVRLLRDALRRQPLLYVLGIGGADEAAARLLQAARFAMTPVPFHFRVEHPGPFFRELRLLRSSLSARLAARAAATTRLGHAGLRALQRRGLRSKLMGTVETVTFSSFDDSADRLWEASRSTFAFAAVRDRDVLGRLYDTDRRSFLKVGIRSEGELRGWAVCLATQGHDHKHFGDLKVGSIVDLLVQPGYEVALIEAAVERLKQEDVDLIVTNQALFAAREGLRRTGFLRGRSNFLFAASPQLTAEIGTPEANLGHFHINRGDGDGPINL